MSGIVSYPGSARASRAVSGALAGNSSGFSIPFGEAPNGAREGAFAPRKYTPQQIIMRRFLHFPHRRAPMFGKAIESAQIRQASQFIFR